MGVQHDDVVQDQTADDSTDYTPHDGDDGMEVVLAESRKQSWLCERCWQTLKIPLLALLLLFSATAIFLLIVSVTSGGETAETVDEIDDTPEVFTRTIPPTSPPTGFPVAGPSDIPSAIPTVTMSPSAFPSELPSLSPTQTPSNLPTQAPTANPTLRTTTAVPTLSPSMSPTIEDETTTFYAIGDVPYTPKQARDIAVQLDEIPGDAEFVVHIGDLQAKQKNETCTSAGYIAASTLLRRSHAPVFVVLGDNEWNDCPNPDEALEYWRDEFEGFDSRHWNHTFSIEHQPGRTENFAFTHKKTLFIFLNIVGGTVHNETEWDIRLVDEVKWTKNVIRDYNAITPGVGRIVIFAHANPQLAHQPFFAPLQRFIQNELQNTVPLLYLNGDKHVWSYDQEFLGQPSFLRIMLTGGSVEPPLKVEVTADGSYRNPWIAFRHDRQF